MNILQLILSCSIVYASCASAWVSPLTTTTTTISTDILSFATSQQAEDAEAENDSTEWGVSYIGGDPCGSKYNNDPFDSKPSRPGFPDDMKARIEVLAERKRRESEGK